MLLPGKYQEVEYLSYIVIPSCELGLTYCAVRLMQNIGDESSVEAFLAFE